MNSNDIIREFVASTLSRDGRAPRDGDLLLEDGIIDSFGIMALLEFVEQTFRIQIGGDDLTPENFRSVQAISVLVDSRRVERAAS